MSKNIVIAILSLFASINASAGQKPIDYPEVGKPCPDFILHEIHQYKYTKASLSDFKGKPLIIDFFEQYCTTCFESFPKLNKLQKEFKDQVQFLIIGYDKNFLQSKIGIREDYQKFQRRYDIDIPVAYDSQTVERFKLRQFPYVVWIDGDGIVQAITISNELTPENIQKFIDRKHLGFKLAKNGEQLDADYFYDETKPLLINGNGGDDTDFLYRSVLMKWQTRQGFNFDRYVSAVNSGNIQGVGLPLYCLYRQAFGDTVSFIMTPSIYEKGENHYGQWYILPVLELKDSSLFDYSIVNEKNIYSYNLTVHGPHSAREMQLKMRSDLYSYFGFDVKVEKRQMPYWRLRATDEAKIKLKTKGGTPLMDCVQSQMRFVNEPVSQLINLLWTYNQYDIFEDETGFTYNFDFTANAVMIELEDVRKALNEQGLILERGVKEMNVIVIRDPLGNGL